VCNCLLWLDLNQSSIRSISRRSSRNIFNNIGGSSVNTKPIGGSSVNMKPVSGSLVILKVFGGNPVKLPK
jgi:hypothetical protein